jgi:hypothetical protein
MTPDQFRAALADLGLSQVGFARIAQVNPRTVRRWCEGTRAVPGPVVALLGMMMAHYRQALETAMLTDGGRPIDPQGIGRHILAPLDPREFIVVASGGGGSHPEPSGGGAEPPLLYPKRDVIDPDVLDSQN